MFKCTRADALYPRIMEHKLVPFKYHRSCLFKFWGHNSEILRVVFYGSVWQVSQRKLNVKRKQAGICQHCSILLSHANSFKYSKTVTWWTFLKIILIVWMAKNDLLLFLQMSPASFHDVDIARRMWQHTSLFTQITLNMTDKWFSCWKKGRKSNNCSVRKMFVGFLF